MVVTHYDVLGISSRATPEEVRRAYLDRARAFHPDRTLGTSAADAGLAARRMQDVNEAWRVLRDPASRAAYARALAGARAGRARPERPPRPRPPAHASEPFDEDLDTPYPQREAAPGDLGVAVARGLPWVAVAVILVAIFVFTAFAGRTDDAPSLRDLVGECVGADAGRTMTSVPCSEPNEGRVVLIVDRSSLCPSSSNTKSVPGGRWLCLEPVG